LKIAFDENVPLGMVRVFQALAGERKLRRQIGSTIEFVSANNYAPRPTDRDFIRGSDVPWLARFAADGGKIVISGDVRMRSEPFERAALVQHGFVTIFFETVWSEWNFFRKSALLLHWWPQVAKKIEIANPGEFYCIPSARTDEDLRRIESAGAIIEKQPSNRSEVVLGRKKTPSAKRPSRHRNNAQGTLDV
jgi:hypothetical protein